MGPSARDIDMEKKSGAATATQSDFKVADGKRARTRLSNPTTLRIAETAKKVAADVPVPVSNQFQALDTDLES